MISYLYRYEEGVKGKNTGYVRIELQGQTCRLTLQLQDKLSALPEVWIFRQMPQGVEKLTVGRLQQSGNGYRCRLETDANDIFGTGQPFQQIDGLIVYLQTSLFYGTTWNDISIQLGNIKAFGGHQPETESETATPDATEDTDADDSLKEISLAIAEEVDEASENIHMEPELPDSNGKWQGAEKPLAAQTAPGTDPVQAQAANLFAGQASPETGWKQEQTVNLSMEQTSSETAEDSQEKSAARGCEQCRYCPRQSGKQDDMGDHIMSLFPKMYPFELESMGECVRFDLKDIGCLPVRCWSLAGNPFLLHGYYCYRHIIFTKLQQGEYCVGVPGIYNRDNQEWAAQCGMQRFQPLSDVAQLQGAFGYWLYPLKL